ncbi:regulatory protein RecX [Flavobacterium sp. H122]|uniref:regulatory protein RecX n=1 Tax=Flavobacterium sp. H122 TaxID=2529860 RepID=UPI0010AAEC0D|nr:regulatory protein RecX [Flavobacterium sp. H122]
MLKSDIKNKIEHYCAYQERCHEEVISKLKSLKLPYDEIDEYMAYLIENNYLNEERFACSFVRGKHNIKKWGKIRLVNELKFRKISRYNIDTALKEISSEAYLNTFNSLAEKEWESIKETNIQKKKRKFCDFLLRKGYESNLIFEKLEELEAVDSRQ